MDAVNKFPCIKAQLGERNTLFIEPVVLLNRCPVKHAYLQDSHITVPWDTGSADKTTKHAWLARSVWVCRRTLAHTWICNRDFVLDCLCNATYAECRMFVWQWDKRIPWQGDERGRGSEHMKGWNDTLALDQHQCPHHNHPHWDSPFFCLQSFFPSLVSLSFFSYLLSLFFSPSFWSLFLCPPPPWTGSDIGLKWDRV